jgi:hypothetical protein
MSPAAMFGLALCADWSVAVGTVSGTAGDENRACGPPIHCARTDRRVEPYPKVPPLLGPAGSIVVDASFGSRILRVTDAKSGPNDRAPSFFTPSSAEQNSWNSDTTKFYVTTPGGQFVLYDFDSKNMSAHQRGPIRLSWIGEPEFSFRHPNLLYGTTGRSPAFQQYDASTGRVTTLHEVSSCLKVGPSDLSRAAIPDADDSRWVTAVGPQQDNNYLVYVYDRKQGCRWYNTQTGEIGGKWGPTGTISIPDRFGVHNVRMSKSGKFVFIARGASTVGREWVIWEVEKMSVVACPTECSGHHVMGFSHILGPSGNNYPMDLLVRPLGSLDRPSRLISEAAPTNGYWYDMHLSWNNADPEDTNPACLSTYRPSNPGTPGTPLDVSGPWENEILCVEMDGKGSKVWRFAHTYSTAKNGFWSTPRGNVSQDGRFFMFTSDWQDQLGRSPNRSQYRTDVFIVELR